MSFVGQVREALETASAEMKSFNEIVRSEIIKDASRKHVGKMYLANLHTSFLCNLIYPTFSRILLYSC